MTDSRSNITRLFAFTTLILVLAASSCTKTNSPAGPAAPTAPSPSARASAAVQQELAKTYGLDAFGQIDAIRYTWNAQFPGVNISRTWTWEPKTNRVTYEGKDKDGKPVKVTYLRSQLNTQPDNVKNEVDPGFINDNYWLLFPFHATWDTSANVQDKGEQSLPLGNGSGDLISVKYPSNGGYTPGDTWDLYVGKDNRVEQLVYHRGGPKKPALVTTTWEDYKQAGPLLISMDHKGNADGNQIRIYFTDVAVKLNGSSNWINAQ